MEKKKSNKGLIIALLALAVLIAVVPLFAQRGADFGGSDDAGSQMVSEITGTEYEPWFTPVLETMLGGELPGEVESLLFCVQTGIGVGIIAFGLNSAAYTAEIFRSGILAVDKGQMEAGRSLGLTHGQTMWSIIFPQGIKNCLPTYASEFIVLVKETAVVGYIGMTDLTKAYSTVQSRTMDAMPPLIIIAVVYFCITKVLSVIFAKMERRLRESDRR